MSGNLYLVPTPIGNLGDMTFRAVEILRQVKVILCEDTRVTQQLCVYFDITTPLEPFHEHNERDRIPQVLKMLQSGDIALVSDAGSPGISDPGFPLVQALINQGINVQALPGATALIPAVTVSGLPTNSFVFLGFLPKSHGLKVKQVAAFRYSTLTVILYESPHRVLETLEFLETQLGDRQVCVARELTKLHETLYRGSFSEVYRQLSASPIKGECVIVLGGSKLVNTIWSEEEVVKSLNDHLSSHLSLSTASKKVAQLSHWPKDEVYKLGITLKKQP